MELEPNPQTLRESITRYQLALSHYHYCVESGVAATEMMLAEQQRQRALNEMNDQRGTGCTSPELPGPPWEAPDPTYLTLSPDGETQRASAADALRVRKGRLADAARVVRREPDNIDAADDEWIRQLAVAVFRHKGQRAADGTYPHARQWKVTWRPGPHDCRCRLTDEWTWTPSANEHRWTASRLILSRPPVRVDDSGELVAAELPTCCPASLRDIAAADADERLLRHPTRTGCNVEWNDAVELRIGRAAAWTPQQGTPLAELELQRTQQELRRRHEATERLRQKRDSLVRELRRAGMTSSEIAAYADVTDGMIRQWLQTSTADSDAPAAPKRSPRAKKQST